MNNEPAAVAAQLPDVAAAPAAACEGGRREGTRQWEFKEGKVLVEKLKQLNATLDLPTSPTAGRLFTTNLSTKWRRRIIIVRRPLSKTMSTRSRDSRRIWCC